MKSEEFGAEKSKELHECFEKNEMYKARRCRGFCCKLSKNDALFMLYFLVFITLLSWI